MRLVKKYKYIIAVIFLFVFLRLPSLFEPYWYGDEGMYLAIGQSLRKGSILYTQIHDNKPPSLYYLAALGQTVFGFRLILFILMIPTVYFFNKLAKKFLAINLSSWATIIFIVITSIPLIEGNISNAEMFMLLPTILAIYFFVSQKSILSTAIVGLLLGVSFTIKIPVVFELFFVVVWLIIINIKNIKESIINILLLSLAFLVPTLVQVLYFFSKGALASYLYAAIFQNFNYISNLEVVTSNNVTPYSMAFKLAFLTIFIFLISLFYVKKKINKNTAFLSLWFIFTIFAALLSSRPYAHYLIQIIPSLILILFLLLSKIPKSNKFVSIVCLFIFTSIVIKYKYYFYPVFSYYSTSYQYIFNKVDKEKYYLLFDDYVPSVYQISQYIKENTSPGDKIFIWDNLPFVYSLSQRLPVGRYTTAYHVHDFNAYDETITQLKVDLPTYIIYKKQEHNDFNDLVDFINLYYYLDNQFGSNVIYKLR